MILFYNSSQGFVILKKMFCFEWKHLQKQQSHCGAISQSEHKQKTINMVKYINSW